MLTRIHGVKIMKLQCLGRGLVGPKRNRQVAGLDLNFPILLYCCSQDPPLDRWPLCSGDRLFWNAEAKSFFAWVMNFWSDFVILFQWWGVKIYPPPPLKMHDKTNTAVVMKHWDTQKMHFQRNGLPFSHTLKDRHHEILSVSEPLSVECRNMYSQQSQHSLAL